MNLLLYLLSVLVWGTTWMAIKLQLGEVAPEVSIFYRFALASTLLLLYCKIKGLSLKFSFKHHLFLFLLGLCMFSIHLQFVYTASYFLVSGMVSIMFSLVSIFNILNSFFFFKKKPEVQVLLGACVGLLGIVVFFWDEVSQLSFQSQALIGAGYALTGALLFSFGNMISRRNNAHKIALIPSSAIAMGYGALIMLAFSLLNNAPFVFPTHLPYLGSLVYLSVVGSIVGFLSFLALIARIGPERAGYATVFFPIIAILISLFFENYKLGLTDFLGMACVFAGNFLVMHKKKKAPLAA